MEKLQPTIEDKRSKSDALIAAAMRGDYIDIMQLDPRETSSETVGMVRLIQTGKLALDSSLLTIQ